MVQIVIWTASHLYYIQPRSQAFHSGLADVIKASAGTTFAYLMEDLRSGGLVLRIFVHHER
ncbi:hypothetical protein SAMN05660653_02207 [Desulfonatronum thiosulfatophilum]|uniref:Uncharacterized protein n=1 Tax=Desulfonatronum thiosulfatophilum TaxID=617002 RepID=A0A1G6DJT0_9BACT|nr:hypothetical protein SAMN05660653_02207 [Desulfonatronum thiosulfatophilum]